MLEQKSGRGQRAKRNAAVVLPPMEGSGLRCTPSRLRLGRKGIAMPTLTVTPVLPYRDVRAAIEFLTRAFGFAEKAVYHGMDGVVVHAELTLGNGMVLLDAVKESSFSKHLVRPAAAGGVTMTVYCVVADTDIHFAKASAAGAEIVRAPVTRDYGGRDYTAEDPEGHLWTFGTYDPVVP